MITVLSYNSSPHTGTVSGLICDMGKTLLMASSPDATFLMNGLPLLTTSPTSSTLR